MKTIAVVSVARSDYGIYRPVLAALTAHPDLNPVVIAGAAHLSERFGKTIREIEKDGYPIGATVEMTQESDEPTAVAKAMGQGVDGFAQAYNQVKPDMVMVLGDRYEMFSAAVATVPLRIPLAHIHGGEISYGAIDEVFRHAMTKLSHLHFASTTEHAHRIRQMGEEDWRVTVSGAPALDAIKAFKPLTRQEFQAKYGFELPPEYVIATFHPATADPTAYGSEGSLFFEALANSELPALVTMPNADTGGLEIRKYLDAHRNSRWIVVENLGVEGYYTAMHYAAAVTGNSSSGIIEAASFGLPVLNVGERQQGRMHSENVLTIPASPSAIEAGLKEIMHPDFLKRASAVINPYGDGYASDRIADTLANTVIDQKLLAKRFVDR